MGRFKNMMKKVAALTGIKDDVLVRGIVLNNIQEHINGGQITDENMLESVLYNCIQEIMYQQSYSIEHNE